MTAAKGKRYIQKLGLKKCNNSLRRASINGDFAIRSEEGIVDMASQMLCGYLRKYGMYCCVVVYVLRQDETVQVFFNDATGAHGIEEKLSIEDAKEFVEEYVADVDYMLIVETKPGYFSLVTQM